MRLTGLFSAMSTNGNLIRHMSKSGSSLMSKPLDMKSKRTIIAFYPTGIDDTLLQDKSRIAEASVFTMIFIFH